MRAEDQTAENGMSALTEQIEQNVESVVSLHRQESESLSPSQRRVETVSRFVGRPAYLVGLLCAIALWTGINLGAGIAGYAAWDAPPFVWLDTAMTFISLVTTTIVLIAQNRLGKLEQQHAHLDLQVNLLTEQKVTKVIHLIEELRRDMPMVRDRRDARAEALQHPADAEEVISAIKEVGLTGDPEKQLGEKR